MTASSDDEAAVRAALHRVPGLGRVRLARLAAGFPTLAAAWRAPLPALLGAGLDPRTARAVVETRRTVRPEAVLAELRAAAVGLSWPGDPGYPRWLAESPDPPPLLLALGAWSDADERSVAVVGTRRATAYGREVAGALAGGLARAGVTVVSGLARGIDTVAHRAALDAGGRTVAVVAGGLDRIYPPENRALAREIATRGAVLSDYPLGTSPRPEHFPRRNRILAGLGPATLVVEGDLDSGAMITARLAVDANRDVLAVPGSVLAPASRGPHALIREGAALVTGVEDLLEVLRWPAPEPPGAPAPDPPAGSRAERAVLGVLDREPRHVDRVVREAGLAADAVSSTLAILELKGLARDVGGLQYVRVPPLRPFNAPIMPAPGSAPRESEMHG